MVKERFGLDVRALVLARKEEQAESCSQRPRRRRGAVRWRSGTLLDDD